MPLHIVMRGEKEDAVAAMKRALKLALRDQSAPGRSEITAETSMIVVALPTARMTLFQTVSANCGWSSTAR